MAAKPNKMGRIKAEPKQKRNLHMKEIGIFAAAVVLLVSGIVGTLTYQAFINSVKAEGVSEYRATECDQFVNEDKSQKWLECDVRNIEK